MYKSIKSAKTSMSTGELAEWMEEQGYSVYDTGDGFYYGEPGEEPLTDTIYYVDKHNRVICDGPGWSDDVPLSKFLKEMKITTDRSKTQKPQTKEYIVLMNPETKKFYLEDKALQGYRIGDLYEINFMTEAEVVYVSTPYVRSYETEPVMDIICEVDFLHYATLYPSMEYVKDFPLPYEPYTVEYKQGVIDERTLKPYAGKDLTVNSSRPIISATHIIASDEL